MSQRKVSKWIKITACDQGYEENKQGAMIKTKEEVVQRRLLCCLGWALEDDKWKEASAFLLLPAALPLILANM